MHDNRKEKRRATALRKYGIDLDDYDDMLEAQNNRCAICDTHIAKLNKPLFVDHDHETNKVRGLLCPICNVGLDMFKDDQKTLLSAINYLRKATGIDELTDYDSKGHPF